MKERRGYIVLVGISILLSVISYIGGVRHADEDGRKFCDVTKAFIAKPVPQPADPHKNPSREQTYIWYERFLTLNHELGC
jgi:hypothetical protein